MVDESGTEGTQEGPAAVSDDLAIEYLLLADRAEILQGKLYVMGGGWNRLGFDRFPRNEALGIAFGVRVPWNETNRLHTFEVVALTADGQELFRAEGNFETGRPAGIPQGFPQLSQFAINVPFPIPKPGQYVLRAVLDGGRARADQPYFAVQVPRFEPPEAT